MSLQNAEEIEDGDVFQIGLRGKIHIVLGYVRGRQHSIEGAVLPGDGNGRGRLLLQRLPGAADGHRLVHDRRRIVIQIADLRADSMDMDRRLHAEAVQNAAGFIADVAQSGGHIFPVADGVAQGGVGHGRDDGVGIGVAVAGYINRFHRMCPFFVVALTVDSFTDGWMR